MSYGWDGGDVSASIDFGECAKVFGAETDNYEGFYLSWNIVPGATGLGEIAHDTGLLQTTCTRDYGVSEGVDDQEYDWSMSLLDGIRIG